MTIGPQAGFQGDAASPTTTSSIPDRTGKLGQSSEAASFTRSPNGDPLTTAQCLTASKRQIFRQADVSRALKGALAAGRRPSRAEITAEGRIFRSFDESALAEPASPFDRWKNLDAR